MSPISTYSDLDAQAIWQGYTTDGTLATFDRERFEADIANANESVANLEDLYSFAINELNYIPELGDTALLDPETLDVWGTENAQDVMETLQEWRQLSQMGAPELQAMAGDIEELLTLVVPDEDVSLFLLEEEPAAPTDADGNRTAVMGSERLLSEQLEETVTFANQVYAADYKAPTGDVGLFDSNNLIHLAFSMNMPGLAFIWLNSGYNDEQRGYQEGIQQSVDKFNVNSTEQIQNIRDRMAEIAEDMDLISMEEGASGEMQELTNLSKELEATLNSLMNLTSTMNDLPMRLLDMASSITQQYQQRGMSILNRW